MISLFWISAVVSYIISTEIFYVWLRKTGFSEIDEWYGDKLLSLLFALMLIFVVFGGLQITYSYWKWQGVIYTVLVVVGIVIFFILNKFLDEWVLSK